MCLSLLQVVVEDATIAVVEESLVMCTVLVSVVFDNG